MTQNATAGVSARRAVANRVPDVLELSCEAGGSYGFNISVTGTAEITRDGERHCVFERRRLRTCVRGRMVRASGQTDSTCHRRTLPMYSVRIAAGNRESYFAVGMLGVGCQRWDRQASVCLVRPSRPRTYRTVTSGVNSRRQRFDEFWRASFGRNLAAGMSVVGHSRNQRRRVGPRIARMTRMNLLRRD